MEGDNDEITKQQILNSANTYFMKLGLQFTIKNKQLHHVTHDEVYTIKCIQCDIFLAICPNEYIYIDNLEKCGDINGNKVIEAIKSFGGYIGVKYIKLYDGAGITSNTCDFIAFAPFSLYTKGKTWYQEHGFNYVSDPHGEIDYSRSKTIPFRYFLSKNELLQFKILFNDIYTNDKSIGDVMKELSKKYLHKNYTEHLSIEQCKLLSDITLNIYELVLPEKSMIYFIPKSKCKTKSRTRRRTKSGTRRRTKSGTKTRTRTVKKMLK